MLQKRWNSACPSARGCSEVQEKGGTIELHVNLSWFPLAFPTARDLSTAIIRFFFFILFSEINTKTIYKYELCLSKIMIKVIFVLDEQAAGGLCPKKYHSCCVFCVFFAASVLQRQQRNFLALAEKSEVIITSVCLSNICKFFHFGEHS